MKVYRFLALSLVLASISLSCKEIDPTPLPPPVVVTPPSPGTANFAKYVAVGNSLTAGFSDNGLFRAGQLVSYPNLLAQRFAQAGGGPFIQPLFGTSEANGSTYLQLVGLPLTGLPNLAPVTHNTAILRYVNTAIPYAFNNDPAGGDDTPVFSQFTGPNQNLGVPGLSMAQVDDVGLGLENTTGFSPFFERLLADDMANATKTYLQYVTEQSAGVTFFTFWLGNNDVLIPAATGGLLPVTPQGTFEANAEALLNVLTAGGADGVIVSIPDVTLVPFFTTITEALILSEVNAGLPMGVPPFADLFIQTAGGPRAMGAGDFLMIGSQDNYANIGQPVGAGAPFPYGLDPNNPITTDAVLDSDEVTLIQNTLNAYNAYLEAEANDRDLAFLEVNALLEQANTTGYPSNGLVYTLDFITGGIVSLDGVHLTPAGNAIVANEILKVINTKYGATFGLYNTTNFSTLPNIRYE